MDSRNEMYYKAKYHEAAKKNRDEGHPHGQFSVEMLSALKDMADKDIWPDWHFGDLECNVWSMFHRYEKGS